MQRNVDTVLASTGEGAAPIQLPPNDLTISLTPAPAWSELNRDLAQASAFRFYLIFEGAAAAAASGVGYNVFLGRTEREPVDVKSPHYAGTLTFYHSFQSAGRKRSVKGRSIALMVTRNLRPLLETGELGRALTVTVSPARPPEASAKAQVTRIKLVSRRND